MSIGWRLQRAKSWLNEGDWSARRSSASWKHAFDHYELAKEIRTAKKCWKQAYSRRQLWIDAIIEKLKILFYCFRETVHGIEVSCRGKGEGKAERWG